MPKRGSDADSRIFFDELVSLSATRLKAAGAIRLEDRQILIPFGGRTKLIGVAHTVFKNGGSWSYFRCPRCGRRAKRLWLIDGAPRCVKCCGSFGRTERLRERDHRVDRLQAMLEGGPLRLKPAPANWATDASIESPDSHGRCGEPASSLASTNCWRTRRSKAASQMSLCRSCTPTNHAQLQSRQSQTSNRSAGPEQPSSSSKL